VEPDQLKSMLLQRERYDVEHELDD
jgi:hypothetical protein